MDHGDLGRLENVGMPLRNPLNECYPCIARFNHRKAPLQSIG